MTPKSRNGSSSVSGPHRPSAPLQATGPLRTTEPLRGWMQERGWTPFEFQEEAWAAWLAGESGLVHAPTGVGKTLAVWGGPLLNGLRAAPPVREAPTESHHPAPPIRHLWITPLRALARDTLLQLEAPVRELGLPWTIELRTGDTSSSRKARQKKRLPTVLITTPESLSLLLSYEQTARQLRGLHGVVVDEWHELMGSKRGVQTELALARLRQWNPSLRVWGLSATLGNLDEARTVLMGSAAKADEDPDRPVAKGRIVAGPHRPPPDIETVLPQNPERFPWAGHLGLGLLDGVIDILDQPGTTLVFTNTRSQAEVWHDALVQARPDWAPEVALHHGSIERKLRREVEDALGAGELRAVVCTSSLDLGVDFPAVDRVIQVGSPKGVGRLLQRAGRSGHTPKGRSRLVGVPAHAFELVEFAAARDAMALGQVEARTPLDRPLDVLAQHLVTVALGTGFRAEALLGEVRTTHAFRRLTDEEWAWTLDFVTRGGAALQAYPRYRRVVEADGVFQVPDRALARRHRMTIGTITDDAQLVVRYQRGARLGTVEESFLSRLRPGDTFIFAGRRLELIRIRDMTAQVRRVRSSKGARGKGGRGAVPRWMGGRMPLSSELGGRVEALLHAWGTGTDPEESSAGVETGAAAGGDHPDSQAPTPLPSATPLPAAFPPERAAVQGLLDVQRQWSRIPDPGELLVEATSSREGHHLFVYPFLGRLVHEGLAALVAWRLSRITPRSIQFSMNDYGFELVSGDPLEPVDWSTVLSPDQLSEHLLQCMNATELARRQFREIARVAGLVFPGYPGRNKSAGQLQVSSGLLFDVLERWDPDNPLLGQARREVLDRELNIRRMREGLEGLQTRTVVVTHPDRFSPLAFPIWAERLHARVSSESWSDRVRKMALSLERAAGGRAAP